MIHITQHANRKLYVPAVHRYTNLTEIRELIQEGENIQIVEQETGVDVTGKYLAQILASMNVKPGALFQLIRKGE